ncbi:HYR domain-containing protein [Flavobacterium ovatum]|uniref:HYR-like domain-containing protein n=1 Tax=Flavobacterium ovatum TaxID=1928857 RepID=UPI00344D2C5C
MKQKYLYFILLILISFSVYSQNIGDYQSSANGDWSTATSWKTWNGSSWVPTTNFPGEISGSYQITVLSTHTITISTNLSTASTGAIVVNTGGVLNLSPSSSPNTISLATSTLDINGGTLNFNLNKVKLNLPSNAVITLENGGKFDGKCTNNDEIFIGTKRYAACVGGGSTVYTFGEVALSGGNVNAEITIPSSDPTSVSECIITNLKGGYTGTEINVTYKWIVRNPDGTSSEITNGSLAHNTETTSTSFTPTTSGQYLISLEVTTTSSATNIETVTINVSADTESPTVTSCPTYGNFTTDTDKCFYNTNPSEPVFSDNCGITAVSWIMTGVTTGSGVNAIDATDFNIGTSTITYTALDAANNSVQCVFTITVTDTTKPVFTLSPANVTIECSASAATAATNGPATATDNCATPVIAFSDVVVNGTGNNKTITRTWTATDANSNVESYVQTITVTDTTKPVFTLSPANLTIECSASTAPAATNGPATATDNCATPTIAFSDVVVNGTGNNKTITRTWTATDANSNVESYVQTITVTDTTKPVFTLSPANLTIECSASTAPAATNGPATATDNCDIPTIAFSDVVVNGTGNNKTITRTWTATDANSNVQSYIQTITVTDTTKPVFTLSPANLTIECSASSAPAATNGPATATDNCATPVIAFSDVVVNGTGNNKTITRTWTATDANSNVESYVQTITITDTTKPVFTLSPANLTIECSASSTPAATNGPATATDNCATPVIAFSDVVVNGTGNNKTITRTWTATDANSNVESYVQTITVTDTTKPVFTLSPANLTIECSASAAPAATNGPATATDNCATPTIAFSDVVVNGTGNNKTITRTWTATDANSNVESYVQTITVTDTTKPVFTLSPANLTIECSASSTPAATNGPATATDNCATPVIAFSDVVVNGTGNNKTITRTWTATDANSNVESYVQTITVTDTTKPVFTLSPANLTIGCSASSAPAATNGPATATDNCATPTIAFSDAISGVSGNNKTITRTWTATDANSNVESYVQTITVTDTTKPVFTLSPANVTIECSASAAPAATNGPATATDNCATPVIAFSDVVVNGTGNNKTITRTWTATDANSNVESYVQTITVTDTTKPVFTLSPANLTIECSASTAPAATNGPATATDNCATPVIAYSDVISGVSGNNKTITRTWTATDANSNVESYVQTITITDTTKPVFTLSPANLTIECSASSTPAATNGPATATDNCATPVIAFSDVVVNGTGNNKTITRTWTATDANSNVESYVQTITVTDTTKPVFTLSPANLTIECSASTAPAATNGPATATDNCATPVIAFSDVVVNGTGNNKTITRTWTATDANSNVESYVQTITVTDTTKPVFTLSPANLTIECSASSTPAATNGPATATDNCATPVIAFSDVVVNGTGNNKTITRTWTATDANSNIESYVQTITVTDTTKPVFTLSPANLTIGCSASSAPAATNGPATATDNCATPVIAFSDVVINGTGNNKTITRTWTATDANSNVESYVQTITITDTTKPVFTLSPANVTIECSASTAPAATNGPATATDNCDIPTIAFSDVVVNGTGNNKTITRTWTATDANSNVQSYIQTITVTDTTKPVFTLSPANLTIECSASSTPAATNGPATATDNCATPVIAFSDVVVNGTGNNKTITRTWTATDANSNVESYVQTITITDTTKPVFTLSPANVTIECSASTAPAATNGPATATDNCDIPTIAFSDVVVNGTGNNKTITRTWTATDANSNVQSYIQTITVTDTTKPVFTLSPANLTIECSASSTPAATNGPATATDNCATPVIAFSDVVVNGTGNNKTITRTWTATDANSNVESYVQTITVTDTTKPVFTLSPANLTIECSASSAPAATNGPATATDNCATPTIAFSDVVVNGTGNNKTITRTWTATDANSNVQSYIQTITVTDTTKPVFTLSPANLTIECSASTAPAATNGPATATDNCATPVIAFSDVVVNGTGNNKTITRTWTATDANSNVESYVQTITVTDTTKPVFTLSPANLTIECSASSAPAATNGPATATDNCDIPTIAFSDVVVNGTGNNKTITRTWTATDANSNVESYVQTITVTDTTKPVFTLSPANLTIECSASSTPAATNGPATATDNCATPVIAFSDVVVNGTGNNKTITRTWTATDANSNVESYVQTITVTDTTKPVFTLSPANLTIECSASSAPAATNGPATATDNCATPVIAFSDVVVNGTGNNKTITRTWTATDANSNVESYVQTITVTDTTKPVFTLSPANVTIECSASAAPAATNGPATATDNCATPTIAYADVISGVSGNNNVITRTWTATDANSNVESYVQTITVTDTTKPVFTLSPANLTIECSASLTPAATNGPATATDNCATPVIAFSDVISGVSGNNKTITRTWTATDANSNVQSYIQTITVTDTTKPVFTLSPANLTIECSASSAPAATNGPATATDNCATPVIAYSDVISGVSGNNKTITRTWTATDANSNVQSYIQTITVTDTTKPTLSAIANRNENIGASCSFIIPNYTGLTTAADNCTAVGSITKTQSPVAGTIINGHNTAQIITITANDANGNSETTSFTITLKDVTPPTLTPAVNQNVTLNASCAVTIPDLKGTATDNCTGTVITQNPAVGSTQAAVHNGTISVTVTATDLAGLTDVKTVTLTVKDVTPPNISCPSNILVSNDAGSCTSSVTTTNPIISDNCTISKLTWAYSGVTTASSAATGINYVGTKTFNKGITNVTYSLTDTAGNSSQCTFTVTIVDNENPITPSLPVVTGQCSVTATIPTTTDNCAGVISGTTGNPLTYSTQGTYTINWNFDDGNGNSIVVPQTVIIKDSTNPVTPTLASITWGCNYTPATPTTTDNCSGTITGTTTVSFPITSTTNVPWTFDDGNGNSITINQLITIDPVLISLTSKSDVLCNGGSTGSINVSISGGKLNYIYSWIGPNGFTSNSKNISALKIGTYSLTTTDANGCTAIYNTTINEPTQLGGSINKINITCKDANDGSATINPTGGKTPYTYLWNNGATSQTINNLAPGNYYVDIKDVNNCVFRVNTSFSNPTELIATGSFTQPNCNGGSNGTTSVSVSGGTSPYFYLWSTNAGVGLANVSTVSNLKVGTYSVDITDSSGCSKVVSITVTEPSLLTATISGKLGCFGGTSGSATATPSGGTAPYTYLWNTNVTSQTISGLTAGTYSVVITDAKGCTTTKSVTNAAPTQLLVTATRVNTTGAGASNGSATANPTGGDLPYTYLWNNGQTTKTATGLIAGTYTVTITDNSGCTATTSIKVADPLVLILTTSSACVGEEDIQTLTIVPTIQGGAGPFTYTWNYGNDANTPTTNTGGTKTVKYLTGGTKIITLTVSDSSGQTMTITKSHNLQVCFEYTVDCDRCVSQDYIFDGFYIGDASGTPVAQCNSGTVLPVYIYFNITSSASPKYNLYVIGGYEVTNPFTGITTTKYVEDCLYPSNGIKDNTIPVGSGKGKLLIDNNYICGTQIKITGLFFAWKENWKTDCGPAKPKCYCSGVNYIVDAPLTAAVNKTDVLCFGGSTGIATVTAYGGTAPYTYIWKNASNTTIGTSGTISGLAAGTYTVTVKDSNSITLAPISVTIGQPSNLPTATTTVSNKNGVNVSCFESTDGTATVTATGGTAPYTYSWNTSPAQTTATATSLGIGTYTATVRDANGCQTTKTATLVGPNPMVLSVSPVNPSCFGYNNGSATISVTSGGTGPFTYLWSNGQTTATATNMIANNSYSVTVTDSNNCTSVTNVTLSQPTRLDVPTTRTNTSCFGTATGSATANPTGGTAPYTYLWFNGQTTKTAVNLAAGGPYTVTVTDFKGCSQAAQVLISDAPQITATASSTNATCNGSFDGTASAVANGGTPGYTYSWNTTPVKTTSNISGLAAGTYTATITDSKGCQTTASTTISQPTVLNVTATGVNVVCFGGTGTANVSISGGTSPYDITWSNGQKTNNVTALIAGTYQVTVTDANFCSSTKSVTITQPLEIPNSNAGTNQSPSCGLEIVTLAANNPSYGTGNWSIVSGPSGGNELFSNNASSTSTFYSPNPGTYVLRWTISDGSSCPSKSSDVSITFSTCSTLDFDGIDDNITFKNNIGITSGKFSIEIWIKPSAVNGNTQTILSKRFANNLTSGYDLRLVNNKISFNWNNTGSIVASYNINTNRWYHVSVSFDGSEYKLYIDGILIKTQAGVLPTANTAECIIGGMDQNLTPPFRPINYYKGWVDELRVWNVALNKDQIHQMMNQELENNGNLVKGKVLGLNIDGLSWNNLTAYFQMNQGTPDIANGYLIPNAGIIQGKLRNIDTWQQETAPLPYFTKNSGVWTDTSPSTPWKWGNSVWDMPNGNGIDGSPIDWNIVVSNHDLSSGDKDINVLGLKLTTPNTLFTIANPNQALNENNNGHGLFISHYLLLNGNIDLVGESQLIQKRYYPSPEQISESIFDNASTGNLERDQQGKKNSFNYNYWSSPVTIRGAANNSPYTLNGVLRDGTDSSNPKTIQFNGNAYYADGPLESPIKISTRWVWSYNSKTLATNSELKNYFLWNHIYNYGSLNAGEGFTMKGTGGIAPITSTQNYVFTGKPNSGTITLGLPLEQTYLVGNPYPSALDADEFIKDNIKDCGTCRGTTNAFNGTLYFWDHLGITGNHTLAEYEGGYATYTLMGGTIATVNGDLNSQSGNSGIKAPGRYIPVAQGFFVDAVRDPSITGMTSTVQGGPLVFKNSQRQFVREGTTNSVFMKSSSTGKMKVSNEVEIDKRPKIRLGYISSTGKNRQLLVGSDINTTTQFDLGYDAPMFDLSDDDLYWTINNSPFVIQALPNFDSSQIIPLGMVITKAGLSTIKIDNLENISNNSEIYLHDKVTNVYHDLRISNFAITLPKGKYTDRFSLRFTKETTLSVDENILKDGINVHFVQDMYNLIIKNEMLDTLVEKVSLYNALGQNINNWKIDDTNQINIQLPLKKVSSGVYLVKTKTNKGTFGTTIIIK